MEEEEGGEEGKEERDEKKRERLMGEEGCRQGYLPVAKKRAKKRVLAEGGVGEEKDDFGVSVENEDEQDVDGRSKEDTVNVEDNGSEDPRVYIVGKGRTRGPLSPTFKKEIKTLLIYDTLIGPSLMDSQERSKLPHNVKTFTKKMFRPLHEDLFSSEA